MTLKLLNLNLILLLVSCSLSFDKEIINYGSNLKSYKDITIIKGETSRSFIVNKFGPPSFINPYNNKNVFYISQEMTKKVGKVNQIQEALFLEIFYNNNDKVIDFKLRKEDLSNKISLSELNEESITENRKTFNFFKNILNNLRRQNID